MRRLLPRGITRSTYPLACNRAPVASCVAGKRVMAFSLMPKSFNTPLMRLIMARLLSSASFPPFSTHALPAFRQSENTSKVTFGRASYTMPITPKGTLTRLRSSPLGRVVCFSTLPRGEGSVATLRVSPAIPSIRSFVSFRRSYMGLAGSIRAKSLALAAKMVSVSLMAFSATASNTLLMVSLSSSARSMLASLDAWNISSNIRILCRACSPCHS